MTGRRKPEEMTNKSNSICHEHATQRLSLWACLCVYPHVHAKPLQSCPLSMGVSRQEYWSGLPCPPPWDLPDPGIKPESPALTGVFFITGPLGKPSHEPTVGQNHLPQSLFYNKVLTSSCNLLTTTPGFSSGHLCM